MVSRQSKDKALASICRIVPILSARHALQSRNPFLRCNPSPSKQAVGFAELGSLPCIEAVQALSTLQSWDMSRQTRYLKTKEEPDIYAGINDYLRGKLLVLSCCSITSLKSDLSSLACVQPVHAELPKLLAAVRKPQLLGAFSHRHT